MTIFPEKQKVIQCLRIKCYENDLKKIHLNLALTFVAASPSSLSQLGTVCIGIYSFQQ